jgi:hypothetical protein
MAAVLGPIRRSARGTIKLLLVLTSALAGDAGAVGSSPLPPSITTAPLSVEQVVNNLIGKDIERAKALRHYESTRIYRLSYRGFLGDRDAEMKVEVTYDSPSTKNFRIISQSGSKAMAEHAFKRLLDSEKEAAEPEMRARTLLNRDNYDFALVGFESSDKGSQYVLAVYPKAISKYVYSGKVWVDATDFAVTRIEAEPAQNPSFWTKKNEVHHEYMKVKEFWLPWRNESVSEIRLGGKATLTIEYDNYRVVDSRHMSGETPKPNSGADAR